jgi:HSP20 family protein
MFSLAKKQEPKPAIKVGDPETAAAAATATYVPRVDIRETGQAYIVQADLPGVDDASVDITVDQGVLTIKGAAKTESPAGYRLVHREFEAGDYLRSFTLPEAIAAERIAATVANGVLTVTVPKAEVAQPRRIAVKAG